MKLRMQALSLAALLPVVMAGCSSEQAVKEISFNNDVAPIFQENCLKCHTPGGPGEQASGLDMTSYDSLMKGTKYGPVVIADDSYSSAIVMLIEGRADPKLKMPHGDNRPLTAEEINALKTWIDQGAKNN
jgi:uncharacterized membrane protein